MRVVGKQSGNAMIGSGMYSWQQHARHDGDEGDDERLCTRVMNKMADNMGPGATRAPFWRHDEQRSVETLVTNRCLMMRSSHYQITFWIGPMQASRNLVISGIPSPLAAVTEYSILVGACR